MDLSMTLSNYDYDVVVIGGGLAGTMAATRCKELNPLLRVALVDKATVGRSGASVFAAGVYNVFLPDEDDADDWVREMVLRGEFLNDQGWVNTYLGRSGDVAISLCRLGEARGRTIFERDSDGRLIRRKSRGHIKTSHCVYHSIESMDTMYEHCQELGVDIFNRTMVRSLLVAEGRCMGVAGFNVRNGQGEVFRAKATIISSAGSGFKSIFVGHRNLTGDMQVEAFQRGAELVNMEMTHGNTVARAHDIHGLNLFVGSGGRFVNGRDEEFMWRYDALGNRARLQDLCIALSREVDEGRGPIYMDMTTVSSEDQAVMRRVLPETFRTWDSAGVDPFNERIEWVVAWAGTRTAGGGIRVNTRCETNISGLYAAGDVTNEPIHGTYAFGGVNIAFAAVSGTIAGEAAGDYASNTRLVLPAVDCLAKDAIHEMVKPLARGQKGTGCSPKEIFLGIQEILVRNVGFVKSEEKLRSALAKLERLEDMAENVAAHDFHELMIALESVSQPVLTDLILRSALIRKESRGFHFRPEFPYSDNENWLKWIIWNRNSGKNNHYLEPVPLLVYAPKQTRHRPAGLTEEEAASMGLGKADIVRSNSDVLHV
jgi:succinate dehydrogenase/fumarate reductase flavoprotein subunit